MAKRHPEDVALYQKLLESTRDFDGVEDRDQAVKLLTERLAKDRSRSEEYAHSRALQVADGFDTAHKPETDSGQMALDIDSYLVVGPSERVRVDNAKAHHTRRWLDVLASNHARVAAAWAAKDMHGRKLLAIQDERGCSVWEAEQILRGSP